MNMGTFVLLLGTTLNGADPAPPAGEITIPNVLVTLIEEIEVPAAELGVLTEIAVKPGDEVAKGKVLARIQDAEAQLAVKKAKAELEIAVRQAENDINIRFAKKSLEVAQAELKRATKAVEKFAKAVSETRLDKLRLDAERGKLEIEQTENNFSIAKLTAQVKQYEVALTERKVERRHITAPISGTVVQVYKHEGEWVEPGEAVLRVLRMDRLRVEGFLDAAVATNRLMGLPVTLKVSLSDRLQMEFSGKVVFVSPEVNAGSSQVRVWAEIDNRDRLLRPGQKGSLTITSAAAASTTGAASTPSP